jgi:holliday junction DNA helicase RuvA
MIAYVRGTIFSKNPQSVVVDIHGIGYQIFIPLSTFYQLPDETKTVSLYVYTHVREDILQLFGFQTETEKQVFLLLISVSGIGPKVALNILSGMGFEELLNAIVREDSDKISSIPGVGKKTSQRIILELKEKASKIAEGIEVTPEAKLEIRDREIYEDALSALINLGYPSKAAKKAIEAALRNGHEMNIEMLLKEALRNLA